MPSKTAYKFSLFIALILGLIGFGFIPNSIQEGSAYMYEAEREAEESEEDGEEKIEIRQQNIGSVSLQGKNILAYKTHNTHTSIKAIISNILEGTFDIFFEAQSTAKQLFFSFCPFIAISPRYILFHRLVFYDRA